MKNPLSLVTGSAGFIGSHVAEALLRAGHTVIGLDDLSGGAIGNNPPDMQFYLGSITDTILVNGLFEQYPFEYIFHCAGHTAELFSHSIRPYHYDNILTGSVNLIHASIVAGSVRNFIFASSSSVHGLTDGTPGDPSLITPYAVAKQAVEWDLRCASQQWGLRHTILRLHNIFGERQNLGADPRNVVARMIHQASRGEAMTLTERGERIVSFAHISEIAPLIAAAVRPEFHLQTIGLGARHHLSERTIAEMIAAALNIPLRIRSVPSQPFIAVPSEDTGLLTQLYGQPIPDRTPEESICSTALWAADLPPLPNRLFDHVDTFNRTPRGGSIVSPLNTVKAA
ncbi:MAG: NAD-dependent epimerase/dehydratase family protein [Bacteroidetes bacterium]|nr:NAD-dependent epimerase/dehydratase family protein [Bacteroidota bacterium]